MATTEVLIGAVADRVAEEADGTIDHRELGSAAMIRLEAPRHRPIHNAAIQVAGRVGLSIAPGAGSKRGRLRVLSIDFPIDRLNGLTLRNVVSACPSVVAQIVELKLAELGQRFSQE